MDIMPSLCNHEDRHVNAMCVVMLRCCILLYCCNFVVTFFRKVQHYNITADLMSLSFFIEFFFEKQPRFC